MYSTLENILEWLKWILLSFAMLWSGSALATHIVGGEMYYTYLGGNQYEITLKVFRDCGSTNTNGTGFDESAKVSIYDNQNNSLYSSTGIALSSATVNYVPVVLSNPCFVLPPDVCVEQAIYKKILFLPPNLAGYTLTHQRCCRNPSIVNLINPQDQGATFTTTIPGTNVLSEGNNSGARFNSLPPVALCWNADFIFDHSATDPDGDSLVYEFCSPLLGGTILDPAPVIPTAPPYTPVAWGTGFSESYPITSDPVFSINPATGFLSGTATQLGQFVIGICVNEFRNGVLINRTNRDFQFNVTVCDPNIIAAGPQDMEFCLGEVVHFENNSTNGSFYHWDFGVPGISSDTSNAFSPSYTYTTADTYTVTLVVNAGWPCADTATAIYTTKNYANPQIILEGYACIDGGDYYDFSAQSDVPSGMNYSWNFGEGSIPQTSSLAHPTHIKMNPEAPEMNVTLTISADEYCTDSNEMTVDNPPDIVASILPQESFCDGYFYQFESVPTPAQSYIWDFGLADGSGISGQSNPGFLFPDTGRYEVSLIVTAPYTCPDTTEMDFVIYGLLNPFFPEQPPMCFDINHYNFQANGASTPDAIYSWDFGMDANIHSSSLKNPQNIVFTQSGYHSVTLTVEENGCERSYTDEVWVPANMTASFDIYNPEGCPTLDVGFVANVHADSQVLYHWELGDGTSVEYPAFNHTYINSGYYDVAVTVQSTSGCIETVTRLFKDTVFVYPVPFARFVIDPQRVNITNSLISVRDSSIGAVSCYYTLSDGSIYNDFDFKHQWSEAGRQTIIQHVMNEYGCKDEQMGEVIVEGFNFYAPNAFTPDNDGVNDVWMPKTIGLNDYHIQVFDRWGEIVFESQNPQEPWIGNFRGNDYFVSNGIYQYVAKFRDKLDFPFEVQGHITVIR